MAALFALSWGFQGQAGSPPALQEIRDEDPSRVDIQLG